jgi:hypothetical protein
MREELTLNKRPKLSHQVDDLGDIVSQLTVNPQSRSDFLDDPASFLASNQIDAGACRLGEGAIHQTAETITTVVVGDISQACSLLCDAAGLVIGVDNATLDKDALAASGVDDMV